MLLHFCRACALHTHIHHEPMKFSLSLIGKKTTAQFFCYLDLVSFRGFHPEDFLVHKARSGYDTQGGNLQFSSPGATGESCQRNHVIFAGKASKTNSSHLANQMQQLAAGIDKAEPTEIVQCILPKA